MVDINYIRVAQTLGITSSAVLAGSLFSISFSTVPSLLLAPAPLLQQQWEAIYQHGKTVGPRVALFSAVNLLFVAYKRYDSGGFGGGEGPWQAYGAAAVITMMIAPYTVVLMRDVNDKLLAAGRRLGKRTEIGIAEEEGVKNCGALCMLFRSQTKKKTKDINLSPTTQSQATSAPPFVFVSGQVPADAAGKLVEGTIAEKTEACINNIKAILAAAGSSIDKVVKTTVFLADMASFAEMNAEYEKHFTGKPARSCVAAKQLPMGVPVEIECIALV
ncbi:hypothetical protein FGG08_004445 [Glutinoglossum americanum]|uniref:YjgF-like protein n=1 Tax=Glutinoglossum americanum TaxID=1670608 RepID=A0A9P8L2H9_9PEZI|nr:hypothetical protein FGG08_004445 [Glutinoglossum americanum]